MDTASAGAAAIFCVHRGAKRPPGTQKVCARKICGGKIMKGGLPAHGDVSAKAGMREGARDDFGEKASGGGGKAERKIFS